MVNKDNGNNYYVILSSLPLHFDFQILSAQRPVHLKRDPPANLSKTATALTFQKYKTYIYSLALIYEQERRQRCVLYFLLSPG